MRWESIIRNPVVPSLVTAILVVRLASAGLSWSGVVLLVIAILWLGIALIDWLYHWRRRRGEDLEALRQTLDRIQAPLSLVFLLDEARDTSLEAVRDCVGPALEAEGISVDQLVESSPDASSPGSIRQFLFRMPSGVFAIFLSSRPYISDPVRFARETIRDKRLRKAVESHSAWISVDLVSATPEESEGRLRAYASIGRFLAMMAGPDCLAIYAPEISRCNEFDPALIERLSSGYPLTIFDEPTFEPVLEIQEDDPRMMAAVEVALSRWPEFVTAFKKRDDSDDDRYIVKAEFSAAERSEFMWVRVTELISGGKIRGVLMNDPHELEDFHRGMLVTFEINRLNDWIYPGDEGKIVGGFTLDVLTDREEDDNK